MTRDSLALLDRSAEVHPTHPRKMPVLIQVPTLPPSKRFTTRARPQARPRRRIRREVKMLAAGLVLGLGSNWMLRWSGDLWNFIDRGTPVAESPEVAPDGTGAPVLPRIEPAEMVKFEIELERPVPEAETLVPVAFPGYLLPDDRYEEATDEGG